jgi:hypothetical protein
MSTEDITARPAGLSTRSAFQNGKPAAAPRPFEQIPKLEEEGISLLCA